MTSAAAVAKIAAGQFGVISRAQATSIGLSKDQIYRLGQSGFWKLVAPGVFIVEGFADCFEQRVMVAVTWAGSGSAASHRTAATLLGLDVAYTTVEVTAPIRRNKVPPGIYLHRSTLERRDRMTTRGLPVTSATRTLLDLGSVVPKNDLETALEAALRKRLTSLPTLRARLGSDARGTRGVAPLRSLLRTREQDVAPTESPLETRFVQFAGRHRLPKMIRQFKIVEQGRLIARVDFAIPEASLAIEVLGYRWHSGRKEWHKDHVRLNRLAQMGWRVLFITKESLDSPRSLAQEIKNALGQNRLFD